MKKFLIPLSLLFFSFPSSLLAAVKFECEGAMFIINRGRVRVKVEETTPDKRLVANLADQFSYDGYQEVNPNVEVREFAIQDDLFDDSKPREWNEAEAVVRKAQDRLHSVLFKGAIHVNFPLEKARKGKFFVIQKPAWANRFASVQVLQLFDQEEKELGKLLVMSHINQCRDLKKK